MISDETEIDVAVALQDENSPMSNNHLVHNGVNELSSAAENASNSNCDDSMNNKDQQSLEKDSGKSNSEKIKRLSNRSPSASSANNEEDNQKDLQRQTISSLSKENLQNDLCEQIATNDPVERRAVLGALEIALGDEEERSSELLSCSKSDNSYTQRLPENNSDFTTGTLSSSSSSFPKAQHRPNTRGSLSSVDELSIYRSVSSVPTNAATRPGVIAVQGRRNQETISVTTDNTSSNIPGPDENNPSTAVEEDPPGITITSTVDVLVNAVLVHDDGTQNESHSSDDSNTHQSRDLLINVPYAEATPMPEEKSNKYDDQKWCRRYYYNGPFILIGLGILIGVMAYFLVEGKGSNDFIEETITNNPTMSLYPTEYPSPSPTLVPTSLVQLTIVIKLDDQPEDTSWSLVCGDSTIYSVPPENYLGQAHRTVAVPALVGEGDDCTFTIKDAARDGSLSSANMHSSFYQIYVGRVITNPAFLLIDGSIPVGVEEESIPFSAMTLATIAPTASPKPHSGFFPKPKITIQIVIQLDLYPLETGWILNCTSPISDEFDTIYSRPARSYITPEELITEAIQVQVGDMCSFEIYDKFNDGLCCDQGNGYYEVSVIKDNTFESTNGPTEIVLLAEGGEFFTQDEIQIDTSEDFFQNANDDDENNQTLGSVSVENEKEEEEEIPDSIIEGGKEQSAP